VPLLALGAYSSLTSFLPAACRLLAVDWERIALPAVGAQNRQEIGKLFAPIIESAPLSLQGNEFWVLAETGAATQINRAANGRPESTASASGARLRGA